MNMNKTMWMMIAGGALAFAACTAQTPAAAPKPSAAAPAGANPTAVLSSTGAFSGSVTSGAKPVTGTVVAAAPATPKPGSAGSLAGNVTYRERVALSPNSVVTVRLVDVTQADAPGIVLAEQVIKNPGNVPIKYELKYDTSKISAKNRYAVQASITDDKGKVTFANETKYPALTGGAPLTNIEVVVKQGVTPAATVAQVTATPAAAAPTANPISATPAVTVTPKVVPTIAVTLTVGVTPTIAAPAKVATPTAPVVTATPIAAAPAITPTKSVTASATATGTVSAPMGVLTGTASYEPKIGLAPGSTAMAVLYEMNAAGVGVKAIARQTISVTGELPVAWQVAYDPAKIQQGKRYGVVVWVYSGKSIYRNSRPMLVISRAETASVNVPMRKIR